MRAKPAKTSRFVKIQKTDEDRRLVYGVVYAPNRLDAHKEMILADDIEAMAHGFLKSATLSKSIDTNHDNWANGSYPVESFIARGHPDWDEGAWVLGVKVVSDKLWKSVRKGDIAGFSFEGTAVKVKANVDISYLPWIVTKTAPAADGHSHFVFARLNSDGKVISGHTSAADGHSHSISKGTATDIESDHKHRFFL